MTGATQGIGLAFSEGLACAESAVVMVEKYIPIGRMQRAEDLVGTAIFLASDASTYITGQTIHVNGGLLMVDWTSDVPAGRRQVQGRAPVRLDRRVLTSSGNSSEDPCTRANRCSSGCTGD